MLARELLLEYSRMKTLKTWGQKLASRFYQESQENEFAKELWQKWLPDNADDEQKWPEEKLADYMAQQLIAWIEYYDPDRENKYSEWITRLYTKGGIEHLEDIAERLREALVYHNRLVRSGKLEHDPNLKNIDKFKSIQQLEELIDKYYSEDMEEVDLDDKAKKFLEKNEAELVYNGPDYLVVTPRTHEASMYFGSGTKWCTTWKNNPSYFQNYSKRGDFYYVYDKNRHTKIAINFGAKEYRDPQDRMIPYEKLFTDYNKVLQVITKKVGKQELYNDPIMAFYDQPENEKNQAMAVRQDPDLVKQIENPSENIKALALDRKPRLIYDLGKDFADTEELKKIVLDKLPSAVLLYQDVTDEQIEKALSKEPDIIKQVDNPTQAMYDKAVKSKPQLVTEFEDKVTDEAKSYAVELKPQLITQLQNVSDDLVNAAVRGDVSLLPGYYDRVTSKTAQYAILKNPQLIREISNPPEDLKKLAVSKNAKLLPELYDDPGRDVVLAAMKSHPVFIYKKFKKKYPDLLDEALQINGSIIKYVKNPTPEQQMKAVKSNPNSYAFIDEPTQDVTDYVAKKRPALVN